MKPEQKIQKKITDFLEGHNAYVVKVISSTKKGVLDLIFCFKGKFVSIEVKTPNTRNNVSELQKLNIKRIQQAGGIAFVAWNVEMVEENLRLNELI